MTEDERRRRKLDPEENYMVSKPMPLLVIALVWPTVVWALDGGPRASTPPPPVVEEPATGMDLVFVKGGCFQMGDVFHDKVGRDDGSDEQPVHEVCLDAFYIGKFEVTQGEWSSVMGQAPSAADNCRGDDCPVDFFRWSDLEIFIDKLNARAGKKTYRLPTEAEWEYAARSGGKNERYSGGNDVESVSWYSVTAGYQTQASTGPVARPVGTKAPNGLGLHDMSGNVYELTGDWYGASYYSVSPRDNPRGPPSGEGRVIRGGCATGDPENSRVARRRQAGDVAPMVGFRLVRIP